MTGLTVTYRAEFRTVRRLPGPPPVAGPPDAPAPPPRPRMPRGGDRTARMLALAHHVEALVDAGQLRDYADAARVLGLTRARMTQVMNLLLLAPAVQERVLLGRGVTSERTLRRAAAEASWADQGRVVQDPGSTRQP